MNTRYKISDTRHRRYMIMISYDMEVLMNTRYLIRVYCHRRYEDMKISYDGEEKREEREGGRGVSYK